MDASTETAASNDTRFTAQAIDPGTFLIANNPNLVNDDYPSATIVGSLSTNSDVDYYSITLQAGQQIILDIDGTTNSLDAFLQLYGPGGSFIGENDDLVTFDPGSNPPFQHNTDSQIIFRAATSVQQVVDGLVRDLDHEKNVAGIPYRQFRPDRPDRRRV